MTTQSHDPGRFQQRRRWPAVAVVFAAVVAAVMALALRQGHGQSSHSAARPQAQPALVSALPAAMEPKAFLAAGKVLFESKGCVACHGDQGKGGVVNANSTTGTVPALNVLAERMMLDSQDQADQMIAQLAAGKDPAALTAEPFANYGRFAAQYRNVRHKVENGAQPGKLDALGPVPPLAMPAWGKILAPRDLDALIAYAISLDKLDE